MQNKPASGVTLNPTTRRHLIIRICSLMLQWTSPKVTKSERLIMTHYGGKNRHYHTQNCASMAIDEVDSMLWEQQPSSARPFSRANLFVKTQSLQHNNFQTRKEKMIEHRSDDEEDEASLLAYSRTSFRMPRIIL